LRETVQNLTREYETVKQQAQDLAKLNGLVSEDQTQLQKKMQTLKESCILFESELIKANVKIEENVVEIAELKAKITSLVHEGSKLVNTVQESSDSKIVKQEAEQFKEFLKAYPRQE
jgi:FtsZ-binding cell division protein ZapB